MSASKDSVRVGVADREVVKDLMEHLNAAFEQFAEDLVRRDETGAGLTYLDAMMGCHNFYKRIILDLEHRTGSTIIRQTAVDTLRAALGVK